MPPSKYQPILKELRGKLLSGVWKKGTCLPSEACLTEYYGCSRNTVRRAIAQLVEEGFVQSIHGKGVVVISDLEPLTKFVIGNLESLQEAAVRNGVSYRTKVISIDDDVLNKAQAKVTGFVPGTEVWIIKRIRYLNDEAVIIETNFLDKGIVPEVSAEKLEMSLYDYLENDLGIRIVTALRKFTVVKCREKDLLYMNLGDYNCVAVVECRTFNSDGAQFEYSESRCRADKFVFYNKARRVR